MSVGAIAGAIAGAMTRATQESTIVCSIGRTAEGPTAVAGAGGVPLKRACASRASFNLSLFSRLGPPGVDGFGFRRPKALKAPTARFSGFVGSARGSARSVPSSMAVSS